MYSSLYHGDSVKITYTFYSSLAHQIDSLHFSKQKHIKLKKKKRRNRTVYCESPRSQWYICENDRGIEVFLE